MRALLFVGVLISIFIFPACEKEVFPLSEEVAIGFNSTIFIQISHEKLEVKFVELMAESRCAPGTTCVWAGFVKVKLKLDGNQFAELGLGEGAVDSVVYNNHVIKLLAVNYDSDDDFGKENKSSVVIRVD